MDVSENSGTPKSSISIGFSIINHPFWGTPFFGNSHMECNHGDLEDNVPFQWGDVLGSILICLGCKLIYPSQQMNECPLKKGPVQKENSLPTIILQGRTVSFGRKNWIPL